MKTRLLIFSMILTCFYITGISQVPMGFNYQAIARDATGNAIINQSIPVKLAIQTSITGGIIYEETFSSIQTNQFGLISLVVGSGTPTTGLFSAINWNQTLFLKTSVKYPGTSPSWTDMGASQINSVPYSLLADKALGVSAGTKISVTSSNDAGTDALFEVKRKDGQTVFAVYPNAVNVYVPKSTYKGVKGGFSVGGFDGSKAGSPTTVQNYLTVSPDSVRIYIDPNPTATKGVKGGFSVGGYDESKGFNDMYLNLTNFNQVNSVVSSSQVLWYPKKNAFLAGNVHIGTPDSVGTNSTALGYQSIAMGNYSQSFGYKTKALGDYSTAIGESSVAGSRTGSNHAFAFGKDSKALGDDSYALGSASTASGFRSFAFGYASQATNTNSLALGNGSGATGVNSTAVGYQSTANGDLSLAVGSYYSYTYTLLPYFSTGKGDSGDGAKGDFIIRLPIIKPLFRTITFNRANIANGKYSMSIGNGNLSDNGGMAIGSNNDATAFGAVALGVSNRAVNTNTYAAGFNNLATGFYATAFGNNTYSKSYGSFVIGQYNEIAGDSTQWVSTDPVFVVGNGLNSTDRSNAVTLYKNGRSIFEGEHANISLNDKRTMRIYIRGIGFITTTSVYGIKSYVNRSDATVNYYYSGYFYNTGTAGTYMGLYADIINNDYLYTSYINGNPADVAEYYKDSNANTEPGDVVIADEKNKESVVKSSKAYQSSVLGVISTKPFIVMGSEMLVDKKSSKTVDGGIATQLALNGRVPVKVSGENGDIKPGDYLTSSSKPGVAMKWTLLDVNSARDFNELKKILSENEMRRNAIIGKAVESFSGNGTGKILVLISLQ